MVTLGSAVVSDESVCAEPLYVSAAHRSLPHVVRFSGGRSSGAMVLSLARSGFLDPGRGDVVLFANTTAEHPETYTFARRVCDEVENVSGVPCFWFEFCTVETASRSGWVRRAAWRLVSRFYRWLPSGSSMTPGYRDDGTAFEELASLAAMLPNRSLRFCTQRLKIQPGISLLSEWFSGGPGPRRLGHSHSEPQTSARGEATRYRGTAMTRGDYERVRTFLHETPLARPEQRWQDFTNVPLGRDGAQRPVVDIWGRSGEPFGYVTLLGLRADEPGRVSRALFEAMLAEGATGRRCRHDSHPGGEIIACPLADADATRETVDEFWARQSYDLGIDGRWGNCVYCPLKGEPALRALAADEAKGGSEAVGPASIRWWADIEDKYGRPSNAEDAHRFRFLSLRAPTYAEIADDPRPRIGAKQNALPCVCAD